MENQKNCLITEMKETNLKEQLSDYLLLQFNSLAIMNQKINQEDTLDFLTFYNYLNFPLPISHKIFNTFSMNKSYITRKEFIDGLVTIYQGEHKAKIDFLISLFDFDKKGLIYKENIEHLIIHLHYYSNDLNTLLSHFENIFTKESTFTHSQMKTFLQSNPDLYYFFYMNFFSRKPFTKSSILYYQRYIKKDYTEGDKKTAFGKREKFIPSDYINQYFRKTTEEHDESTSTNADDDDLELLDDFENDFSQFKEDASDNIKGISLQSFYANKALMKNEKKNTKMSFHRQSNRRSTNSVICFKPFENKAPSVNEIAKKIYAYLFDDNIKKMTKIIMHIIDDDIYVIKVNSKNEELHLLCLISMKHLFASIATAENNELILKHRDKANDSIQILKLSSQISTQQRINYIGLESMKELQSLIEIIHTTTSYSDIDDYYTCLENISHGSFGKIYRVEHNITKKIFALKILSKNPNSDIVDKLSFKYEEYILGLFVNSFHEGIVKCYEIYEDEQGLYIIQDYYPEGNLEEYFIRKSSHIESSIILNLLKEINSAINYLHKYGIVHRDLKTQNILFNKGHPVIIDFGLSAIIGKHEMLYERCGTPAYLAPEIISNCPYNHAVDIWCLGVIGYYLLYGKYHFQDNENNFNDMYRKIVLITYDFPEVFNNENNQIRLFTIKCLEKNPFNRLNKVFSCPK